jgi:hypothetical protein
LNIAEELNQQNILLKQMQKITKIIVVFLCFLLIFQQAGFTEMAVQLNLGGYLGGLHSGFPQDKFRPLHLRYLSYDNFNNSFRLLLDKGDTKNPQTQELETTSKTLLNYFFIGLALPNDAFWVNLRPDSEDNIIDPWLAQTDIGRIMLETDLQLKKDTAKATSPETPEGRKYWDLLYKKAEELFGYENVTIPTLTRPWIVPGEIIIRETADSAYIYKATLKVMLEQDYLKDSATYNFKDPRLKALNEYSSQLIRELIIPKLTKEVNSSKRYASLRQVYYSLIMAQWFKARHKKGLSPKGTVPELIDSHNLSNLTSKTPWTKTTYFQEYQQSFQKGEYNLQEPRTTPFGHAIRSYFSGGMELSATQKAAVKSGVFPGISAPPANPQNIAVEVKGGQLKPMGIRSPADEHRDRHLGDRHTEFEKSASYSSEEDVFGVKARVTSSDLGDIGAYHFTSPQYGLIIVLNNKLYNADERQRVYGEARFHEAREAYWENQGFIQQEAHIIAWAEQIQRFSPGGDCLTPYHLLEMINMSPEARRAIAQEGEIARTGHHAVLERANREHSAGIDIERIKEYEYRVRTIAPAEGEVGWHTQRLLKDIIDSRVASNDKGPLPYARDKQAQKMLTLSDSTAGSVRSLLDESPSSAEQALLMEACAGALLQQKGDTATAVNTVASLLGFNEALGQRIASIRASEDTRYYRRRHADDLGRLQKAIAQGPTYSGYKSEAEFRERRGERQVSAQTLWQNAVAQAAEDLQRGIAAGVEITEKERAQIKEDALMFCANTALEEGLDELIEHGEYLTKKLKDELGIDIPLGVISQRVAEEARQRLVNPEISALPGPEGGEKVAAVDYRDSVAKHLETLKGALQQDFPGQETVEIRISLHSYNYWLRVVGSQGGSFFDAFWAAYFFADMERRVSHDAPQLWRDQNQKPTRWVSVDELRPQAYLDLMSEATNLVTGNWQSCLGNIIRSRQYDDFLNIIGRILIKHGFSPQDQRKQTEAQSSFLADLQTLGLQRGASWQEVRNQYRQLSRQWHPDVNPENRAEANRRLAEINAAYSRLQAFQRTRPDLFPVARAQAGDKKAGPDEGRTIGAASVWEMQVLQLEEEAHRLADQGEIAEAILALEDALANAQRLQGTISIPDEGIIAGKIKELSALLASLRRNTPAQPSTPAAEKPLGGIDFRSLPIVTQAIGNLCVNLSGATLQRLSNVNVDEELNQLQRMLNSGITPSTERIKEYIQASCAKNDFNKDKIILYISDILRSEEDSCTSTEPGLRDILVVLESARSNAELQEVFLGKKS